MEYPDVQTPVPVIGQVTVIAEIYACGCLRGHTPQGYLAEAAFCEEALPIERGRLALRRLQRDTELEDPAMDEIIPGLENLEEDLEAHRRAAGVVQKVVRGSASDPDLLPGDVPMLIPAAHAPPASKTTVGRKKGGSP